MEQFIHAMIVAAIPLLFAGIGELVTERSGVLNLGLEGMMLMGAVMAFIVAQQTGWSILGVFAGACAGGAMAMLFALLAVTMASNQAATGLALTIFGIGFSGLIGHAYIGQSRPPLPQLESALLPENSWLWAFLGHDAMVYGAFFLIAVVAWFLQFTRAGLALRAVGYNHHSAHAMGLKVLHIRWMATVFGGACAGLGGAYLSLAYTPLWGEEMTAGKGWIALALVVFAAWRSIWLVIGALIFAAAGQLHLYGQAWQFDLSALGLGMVQPPSQLWAMMPYLATILALVFISVSGWRGRTAPACLGIGYRPET